MTRPRAIQLETGQALALVALFSGVAAGVLLKATETIPPGQAIAWRSALAFAAIALAVVLRKGASPGMIGSRGLLRAMLDAVAGLTFALAIFQIPLSLLASIHATLPILSVVLSGAMLGERLRPVTWVALCLACLGTLLILKPGLAFSPLGIGLALISTLAYALRDVVTRLLPPRTDTLKIALASLALVGIAAALIPSGQAWSLPPAHDLILIILAAIGFIGANVLIIAALRSTSVGQIAPLRYTSVLWSLIFDATLWGYVPDAAGWAGIALILTAGLLQFRATTERPR